MAGAAHRVVLGSHAQTPAGQPVRLAVDVLRAAGGELSCTFALQAQLSQLALPPAGAGARRDALWRHTCFELFMSPSGQSLYYEFNFSPSLEWAAYRFDDYRRGMQPAQLAQPPSLTRTEQPGELRLAATIALAGLAGVEGAARLDLGLAAVLEERDGTLSYWALEHPCARPDFHQRQAFTLALRRA
ncbi:MAG TPA: DOMON-like domain-containing protein [Steroidobacteraceae bacterium]|nr:DOMON-like domain-containing protein [Steroidobacteraceae bacterium]